jgi:hypothetical protein
MGGDEAAASPARRQRQSHASFALPLLAKCIQGFNLSPMGSVRQEPVAARIASASKPRTPVLPSGHGGTRCLPPVSTELHHPVRASLGLPLPAPMRVPVRRLPNASSLRSFLPLHYLAGTLVSYAVRGGSARSAAAHVRTGQERRWWACGLGPVQKKWTGVASTGVS